MTQHTLTMDKENIQLIVRALIKYVPVADETIPLSMLKTQTTAKHNLVVWLEYYLEHTEEL